MDKKHSLGISKISHIGALMPREIRDMYDTIPSLNMPIEQGQKTMVSSPTNNLNYEGYVAAPMLLITRDTEKYLDNQINIIGNLYTDIGVFPFNYTYDYPFTPYVELELPAIDKGRGAFVLVNGIDLQLNSGDYLTCTIIQRDIWSGRRN